MATVKMTDAYVRALQPSTDGRYEITDETRPGLRLRVAPTGRKTWMFEKRVKGGKKRKYDLGAYPHTSIKDARRLALELQLEAEKGIDRKALAEERKKQLEQDQKSAVPVRDVLELYRELHLSNLTSGRERERVLREAFADKLDIPCREIEQEDLQSAIDRKASSGAKVQANRMQAALSHFALFARSRGHLPAGVGLELQKAAKERHRERTPSVQEVQAIWAASFDMGDLWGPLLRLLILTAQRKQEVAALKWNEIDLQKRRLELRGRRTKNANPHITHLSEPSLAELIRLRAGAEEDAVFVFTTTGKTPVSGFSKMKRRLDRLLDDDFEDWHLHDLRRSFATAMADAGEPEGVVDRVLNHEATSSAPSAVSRVYNRAKLLSQRERVLDRWANIVTGVEEVSASVLRSA